MEFTGQPNWPFGGIMRKRQRVGYTRVSALDQNTERQLDGIELDKVFTDRASGKDTKSLSVNNGVHFPSVPTGVGDGGTRWREQGWNHG